jgi:RNA polymerase sigma factor for flagellar operon FliA
LASTTTGSRGGYDSWLQRRNDAVVAELEQVQQIARTIHARLPGRVPIEDLISAGVIGLIDAVSKFDPRRNAELRSYAHYRIRGAILDGLREEDWAPRELRRWGRQLEEARETLHVRLSREPSLAEVAAELGIPEETAHTLAQDLNGCRLASLQDREPKTGVLIQDALVDSSGRDPFEQCKQKEMRDLLVRAIAALPRRMRQVMDLYYFRGMSMTEVGAEIGVSESRVSQIHSQAVRTLRTVMKRILDSRADASRTSAGMAGEATPNLRSLSHAGSNRAVPRRAAKGARARAGR